MILRFMEAGNPITALDALGMMGVFRLAARIEELRKKGHNIVTEEVTDNGKTYARYHLVKGK
jgi:hypothetical protein